ncbi:uncharacterized protein [Amphiura filiformis]|uniref:uncharacterized protein isoform X2 n=1 Tax=Amphiura filiformis TaxID=82378 RepID=UPI003B21DF3C
MMAVSKQKRSLQELIPDINESIKYLKTCKDYSTEKAFRHISRINTVPEASPCDDLEALAKYFGSSDIGSLFPKMWKALSIYLDKGKWESQGFRNLEEMLLGFGNIANDSPELGVALGKCGGISLLFVALKQMKSKKEAHYMMRLILTLLINAIRLCPSNLSFYRKSNAVHILKGFLELDTIWQVFSLLILAYVATDSEKKELASTEIGVKVLIKILKEAVGSNKEGVFSGLDDHYASSTGTGFSACEVLDAINKLAINDDVKGVIADEEAIPFIIRMLQDEFSPEEQKVAANALWNLAFIDSLRQSDLLQGTVQTLKKLTKSSNKELRGSCVSALFVFQGSVSIDPNSSPSRNTPPPPYQEAISDPDPSSVRRSAQIMISYQWDSQDRVIRIRDRLVTAGYKVWMDLTNMRDILDGMAEAVQTSDVVLMCMTERYKDSKNCRSEARYAYKLDKKVIPLMFQKDYKPDGWLGLLQGMDLYYAFDSDDQISKNMGQLLKAIAGDYPKATTGDEIEGPIKLSRPELPIDSPNAASIKPGDTTAGAWSREEVQRWLKDKELTELCEKFKRFDGRHLQRMYAKCCKDDEKFEEELLAKYNLDPVLCTEFIVTLQDAFKD